MNLWPARLHHLRRDSPQPERLATFYGELLGDRVERLGEDAWLLAGRHRRLVIGRGTAGAVPYFALQMQDATQRASTRVSSSRSGYVVRRRRRRFSAPAPSRSRIRTHAGSSSDCLKKFAAKAACLRGCSILSAPLAVCRRW